MISLNIQLSSLFFSFLFGVFFGILVKINYVVLFNVKKSIRLVGSFFFMLDVSLLYFILLKIINNGIVHIYFFIFFLIGWILLDRFVKK